MNRILKSLVLSDLFILSSFGLIQPIFAVYLLTQVVGTTISAAGMAVTIQLLTKALFQVGVAKWTDEERGNCRELYTLVGGSVIISIVPLGYAMSYQLWHIYLTQFFLGLGLALSYPSWRVLFSRYMDSDRAGYEWGIYDTVTSLGIACTAALGGYLAEAFSFRVLFIIVSLLSFVGSGFLVHIFNQERTCTRFFCGLPFVKKRHR